MKLDSLYVNLQTFISKRFASVNVILDSLGYIKYMLEVELVSSYLLKCSYEKLQVLPGICTSWTVLVCLPASAENKAPSCGRVVWEGSMGGSCGRVLWKGRGCSLMMLLCGCVCPSLDLQWFSAHKRELCGSQALHVQSPLCES